MKSKKEAIQEAAIELFNERGYEKVSLRDIARQADTTIGNLNYHFSRKEDLLLHIQMDSHNTFNDFFCSNLTGVELLEMIVDSFVKAGNNQEERPFYYKNVYDLTKDSIEASNKNMLFQKQLYDFYVKSFELLMKDGFFVGTLDKISISTLAQVIITAYAVWLQSNTPYSNVCLIENKIPLTSILCSLLRQYITNDKRDRFDLICKSKGI